MPVALRRVPPTACHPGRGVLRWLHLQRAPRRPNKGRTTNRTKSKTTSGTAIKASRTKKEDLKKELKSEFVKKESFRARRRTALLQS